MLTIPHTRLSAEALMGVLDNFILREGTDYGHRDYTLEEKRQRVLAMLENEQADICYHPENEHIEICLRET